MLNHISFPSSIVVIFALGLAPAGCSSASGGAAPGSSGSGSGTGGVADASGASGSSGGGAGGSGAADAAAASGSMGGSGAGTGTSGSSDGSAEAGPSAGGHDGGGTTGCPAGAIFCADFESGSIPTQAVYFPTYQQAMSSTFLAIDSTTAHGGTHSLKVTPGGNFSQMLGVTTGTPTFWTRVYVRQDIDTHTVSGHDTFVAATDADGDPNNGQYVRIGEHSCQLEINRKSDDKEILSDAVNGASTYACAGGIAFAPSTWYCLETFYDGPKSTVRVFVNGAETTALHVSDWGPYTYKMFKFGFENYGGTPRTLWYDDVVVASQQVGCN